MKIGGEKHHEGRAAPPTYRGDSRKRALKHGFLGRGTFPLGLDEDDPAVVTMVVVTVAKPNRAYKILDK
jgi:hypothetical protein